MYLVVKLKIRRINRNLDIFALKDKYYFKVPSLRNIALTAPYMHDAKAVTLEDAVFEMFEHQVGDAYTQVEMDAIVAFLKTLTGEEPAVLKEP